MPGNALPIARTWRPRPGQDLPIVTLAPQFESERHQVYYDLLERAIDAEGVRNIALTGAYGTGKSSVLEHLDHERAARVVKLSLSTIAPEVHDRDTSKAVDSSGSSHSRTNQIQKEIVKQLLYRLPPERVPGSRFRRATVPDERRDRWIALGAGTAVFGFLFGLGILQPAVESLLPALWRQIVAYPLLLALSVVVAWAAVRIIRARPTLSASVTTGPATVTLSQQSDSYFDEYLDEIVYFFQASRRDIVVIEDIDRFEDVQVFDTLRALNGLLNASEQVGRRIVFVYAIRDSVFEQIGGKPGTAPKAPQVDRAKATLERANRTKFFDVIIPVVPFVSADNARDVMSEVMESTDFKIDPALIRLAARHVADMRLIRNIRNEFEVYRNRLVVPDDRIPGITNDLVFAIVLYKNTHLADFEKIRHRQSTLDTLYTIWRDLVRQNLDAQASTLAHLRDDRDLAATLAARAARLGGLLTEFTNTLATSAHVHSSTVIVTLTGPATDENSSQPEPWVEIASGSNQKVTLHDPGQYRPAPITLSFSAEQLGKFLGTKLDKREWDTADQDALTKEILTSEERLRFLRHHTWHGLCARDDLPIDVTPLGLADAAGNPFTGTLTFNEVIGAVLRSDLARDLVRHGFLTSHFALYASSYYGNHLGRDAIEYIRRCVEPGEPDPTFPLTEEDVEQILREQGADTKDDAALFGDVSVDNVSILDYLLTHRVGAASVVARRLARTAPGDTEFIDTYVQHGGHAGTLLALMAPHWNGVVRYAAVDAPADRENRVALLDAVLPVLPSANYAVDERVGQLLAGVFRELDAICRPGSPNQARIVMKLIHACRVQLDSLEPLNSDALAMALELRLFPLNEENLRVVVPAGTIALDVIRSISTDAYEYTLDQLPDYLDLVDSSADVAAVADPSQFANILDDVADLDDTALIDALVSRCGPECRVPDLEEVDPRAWPALAATLRTDSSWDNTTAYRENFGMDGAVAALLSKHRKIDGAKDQPVADRRELAVAILSARDVIPTAAARVALAASIEPGHIPATALEAESTDLVAKLLRRRLLADDSTTFSGSLFTDWPSREVAISASKKYATFVSPELLPASVLAPFIRSTVISQPVRYAVIERLPEFLTGASRSQARTIADALISTRWRLPHDMIEALRVVGATATQVVELGTLRGTDLSTSSIKALLSALGGDYQKVAVGGRGRPTFPVSAAHRYVLGRLVGDTIREVEERTFKGKGTQLIAHLRSAG